MSLEVSLEGILKEREWMKFLRVMFLKGVPSGQCLMGIRCAVIENANLRSHSNPTESKYQANSL